MFPKTCRIFYATTISCAHFSNLAVQRATLYMSTSPNPTGAEHYIHVLDANLWEKEVWFSKLTSSFASTLRDILLRLKGITLLIHLVYPSLRSEPADCGRQDVVAVGRTFPMNICKCVTQPSRNYVQQRAYPLDSRTLGQPLAFNNLPLLPSLFFLQWTVPFQDIKCTLIQGQGAKGS